MYLENVTKRAVVLLAVKQGRVTCSVKFELPSTVIPGRDSVQFVIFKPLSYCFEETIRFDVKASFASRPLSRLIR